MEAVAVRDDAEALLSECLIFQALESEDRRALATRTHRKAYRAGDTIFLAGDPGRSMMVVAQGSVRVTLPTDGGEEIKLAELERGGVLGEVALLDGRPRSASALAITDCEMLLLERPAIGPLLRSNPRASLAIVELLCERLRHADKRMAEVGLA